MVPADAPVDCICMQPMREVNHGGAAHLVAWLIAESVELHFGARVFFTAGN